MGISPVRADETIATFAASGSTPSFSPPYQLLRLTMRKDPAPGRRPRFAGDKQHSYRVAYDRYVSCTATNC